MLGGSFNVLDLEFTLGLGYAFGKELVKKQSKALSPDTNSSLVDIFDGANFSYQSFKFVFGFAL